jgi:divalent metal cation (Fe/Co/Zn/Cd) transporter
MKEGRKEDLIAFIEGLILVAVGFGIVALIVA